MSKLKNDVETIESFIQRLHDLDIIIDQKALDIPITKYEADQPPQTKNLVDVLTLMVENYKEHSKDNFRDMFAKICAGWIDKAYIYGVVKEGNGLATKFNDCKSQQEELQKTLDEISDRNIRLEFENQDLQSELEQSEKFQRVFRQENK
ncbi:MAG: hypothetical protein WCF23_18290 [Candidatus Nitrosopolaris sp.]